MLPGFALAVALAGSPDFNALRSAWSQTLYAHQLDASVALYTEDGAFVLPNGQRFTGSAAIRKLYQNVFKMYRGRMVFHSLKTLVSGDLAYDSGTWNEELTSMATGKMHKTGGSYVTIYRRDTRGWRIAEQVWTSPTLE